jgi:hypothetical protein
MLQVLLKRRQLMISQHCVIAPRIRNFGTKQRRVFRTPGHFILDEIDVVTR